MSAESADGSRAAPPRRRSRRSLPSLAGVAVLVLVLHAWLLVHLGEALGVGSSDEPAGAAVHLRRIDGSPAAVAAADRAPAEPVAPAEPAGEALPPPAEVVASPARPRLADAASLPRPSAAVEAADRQLVAAAALASAAAVAPASNGAAGEAEVTRSDAAPAGASAPMPAAVRAPAATSADALVPVAEVSVAASSASSAAGAETEAAAASAPALLAAGEAPPPVYATRLPASTLLRYEVRRGFLRGSGEMRWRNAGSTYALSFEARIAGIAILTQTSTGRIDANGLAPERFVDQRARRPPQAANFPRDSGQIGFSGSSSQWPLYPGTQDRLGVLVQLAGIAAAAPDSLVEGARLRIVVVGARGDANVWTVRSAGIESVDTVAGAVQAIKLVRQARGPGDTGVEVWLDPEHGYLPVHATFRNAAGAPEYDILLERTEALP